MPDNPQIFLKLGGSLITDKNQAETVREDVIHNCLAQVKRWLNENPSSRLLLGHGSGSFGHYAAKTFHTREGVRNQQDWMGYASVWQSARKLNNFFINACVTLGIPVVDFPISAVAITNNRVVETWNLESLVETFNHHLVPVVHGDVCIDHSLGGTILSTEEIFGHLTNQLKPNRILLAGAEGGVYADFPANQRLIPLLSASADLSRFLQGSKASDVTGGMAAKVALSQEIVQANPGLEINIFSGFETDAVYKALTGEASGTLIF